MPLSLLCFNAVQPAKAISLITVTPAGTMTDSIDEQFKNAEFPIVFNESGKVTVLINEHSANALSPISVTLKVQ